MLIGVDSQPQSPLKCVLGIGDGKGGRSHEIFSGPHRLLCLFCNLAGDNEEPGEIQSALRAESRVYCRVTRRDCRSRPSELSRGVWAGNVSFQSTIEMCVALVVEKIEADGKVDTKFVWLTGSSTGIENLASLGAVSWSGKIEGDTLRLVGTNNGNTYTYVFRPNGANEMTG